MKRILLLSLFIISSLYAQQTNPQSAFGSLNVGIYDIAQNQFDKTYNSNIGFLPGITVGLPILTQTYLYGKISYFTKNGVPENNELELQNGNPVVIPEDRGGTATFREWLFNAGLLYDFILSNNYTLGINGGIVFVSVNEEKNGPAGSYWAVTKGGGFLGLFGGVILERKFENSPFSLVGEVQYNLSRSGIISGLGNDGGLNINLGLRFYFVSLNNQ